MNYRTMAVLAAMSCTTLAADAGESLYRCQRGIVSIGGADVVEELYSYGGGSSIPYVLRLRGGKLVAIERQPH